MTMRWALIGFVAILAGCGSSLADSPDGRPPSVPDAANISDGLPPAVDENAGSDLALSQNDATQGGDGPMSPMSMMDTGGRIDGSGSFVDAGPSVDAMGNVDGSRAGQLLLSLDPSIDTSDDDVIATSITGADLLDTAGRTIASATISGQTAVFSLSGLTAGDYFVRVNGDGNDLVPTRINDPSSSIEQRVGQKLRASYIGPSASPSYRINTYSAGQSESPIVRFSDGTTVPDEQPYVILTLGAPNIELRVLGTAALLDSVVPSATHMMDNEPFDSWLINTNGKDHHGDAYNADGGAATCGLCHRDVATKPASFSAITAASGWCYRCHNGTSGSHSGFFDPSK